MRVALVHDALVNRGGAERVFQVLCTQFPSAPIYTSVYLPESTLPYFATREIRTTRLQSVVKDEGRLKTLFPLAMVLMSQIKLDTSDVIISSSTFCAKFVRDGRSPHICLCYRPFRLLWSPAEYRGGRSGALRRALLPLALPLFRRMDYAAAQRVHTFITTTPEMRDLIAAFYKREAHVIPPPISLTPRDRKSERGDFFLIVSRLEPYKRVDIAVEAFNALGFRLVIVGTGSEAKRLRRTARPNVEFLGSVTDEDLAELYGRCRAVVCPQEEDFGLVPLEANAWGKAAICYGGGGARCTMVPHVGSNEETATAVFFYEQSGNALALAVSSFETLRFREDVLRKNAFRFDPQAFTRSLGDVVARVVNGH